ncbi:MFS transporter [Millisia brevis]|uniref:MFS transporter n=1 Tax=Millisia brevis TaxID=264148 RepID=UPI0008368EDC|nr:MFS transporter [Millisia brevis]
MTETIAGSDSRTPQRSRARWVALLVICIAELLVLLDNTIVVVALPTMALDMQARFSSMQWIVDAYTLTFACFLLALGHLADRYGRRRIMMIGLAGVAVMSLVGALATGIEQVLIARAGMGVFAAAVFPATLALVIAIFEPGKARALAVAAWTAMAGFAVGIGPTVGGWLLEHFSWHSVFWINVPIALLVAGAAMIWVPESRSGHSGRMDIPGIALSLVAVGVLVWTIIEAPHRGWVSPVSIAGYVISVLALVAFVRRESRVEFPVLNIGLFALPRFSMPAMAIAVAYFSMFGFLFLISQYFQGVREYGPLQFGLASLPFAVAVAVTAPAATMIAQCAGATAMIVLGLVVLSGGMFIAGSVTVDTPYVGPVLLSMVLMGIGLAIVQGPATDSIMGSVGLDEAGAGSAVNDTTREIGGALGIAILGSIVASYYTSTVRPLVDAVPTALMSDLDKEFAANSVLAVLEMSNRDTPALFDAAKADLILSMKSATLEGFQYATWATVGACLVCAVIVALRMPWKPAASALLDTRG